MRVLLVLLCFACSVSSWARSNPPIPSVGVNVQQKDRKAEEAAKQGAKIEHGTLDASNSPNRIPAAISDADARHKEYEHHEKPTLDRWLTYSTVALSVFTLGLAIYTAKLFRATVTLSQDAKETGFQQAMDTQAALRIAKQAADATRALVESTNANAQMQLRAYVSRSGGPETLTYGISAFKAFSTLSNSGQTPAHKVHCWSKLAALDTPLSPDFVFEAAPEEIDGPRFVIHPGASLKQSCSLTCDTSEHNAVGMGHKNLYLWGEIRYSDVFDAPRVTKFRLVAKFVYDQETGERPAVWSYCNEGNEAT